MRLLILLFLSSIITLSYADNAWISLAPVTPESLNRFVQQTGLFKEAHIPTMKQTEQYSIHATTGRHYSIYTMQPQLKINKVTQYNTIEHVVDGSGFPGIPEGASAIVYGQGLSLGGIFWPKESMRVYDPAHKLIYDNQIDITAIKPLSGNLFPMHVGAELQFAFQRTHLRLFGRKTTVTHDTGIMTYKVVKEIKKFNFSRKTIPGPIYEIEVWESTNLHPRVYLTDIYQYSDGFHWYISDKYYTEDNRLLAWYRVKNWS